MKPVVIDLCCGLGGWTRGFLAEGWDAIGFDIEKHEYGEKRYPAQLILKDIRQLCGYDLRAVNPALVVASPPCQRYSWMAMPFSRGKREAAWQRWERDSPFGNFWLNDLFNACLRIAREIGCPIVLENVKGAQPWVGRAQAHYGSYYLWGDVGNVGGRVVRADRPAKFGEYVRPANLRSVSKNNGTEGGSWFNVAHGESIPGNQRGAPQRGDGMKAAGHNFHAFENGLGSSPSFNGGEHETRGVATKNDGGSWFNQAHNTESGRGQNPVMGLKTVGHVNKRDGFDHTRHLTNQRESDGVKHGGDCFNDPDWPGKQGGVKQHLSGPEWFDKGAAAVSSKSDSRKAASAMIAEIPFDLAQYIARVFKPS